MDTQIRNITLRDDEVATTPENATEGTCQSKAFFDAYYSKSRFGFETLLCVIALIMNIVTIVFIKATRQKATPSKILFLNLAVTNMLSSALFWLCNNILYLFGRYLIPLMTVQRSRCTVSLLLMAAAFLSSLFIVTSSLTLLGFAVVQFIAICRPLQSLLVITLTKIRIYLCIIWTIAGFASYLPFFVLLAKTSWVPCTARVQDEIQTVTIFAANISACCTVGLFCVLIGVCIRVYVEIRMLRKRLDKFRQLQDTVSDRKAFTTTLIFILTLTLFYVPYETLYVVTLNVDLGCDFKNTALMFYMNFLPYLKFCTDPVVYGLRMREITARCRSLLLRRRRGVSEYEMQTRSSTNNASLTYG